MSNLVSLIEIKEFLKIKLDNDSEDDRLLSINTYVSKLIESYCGRAFNAATYTEYFDGGTSSVFIDNPPIVNVHEVSHYNGDVYQVLGGPGPNGQQIETEGSSLKVTCINNAKTTTRVKNFGSSSLLLDGQSYLLVEDSDDFDFDSYPFTIEAFVRPRSLSNSSIMSRYEDSANFWELSNDANTGIYFKVVSSNVETVYVEGTSLDANTFTHVAIVKDDFAYKLYKNGTQVGNTVVSSNIVPSLSAAVNIGKKEDNYFVGNIDEVRVSWTDRYATTFTPSTTPFSSDEYTKLLLHFNEGQNKTNIVDYSRKVNDFVWYKDTGEISIDSRMGSGTPSLGFFSPNKFSNYTNGVRVNYTGGFLSIPSDLKLAALEMIKVLYKGREGAKTLRLQGDDTTYHDLASDGFPPQVKRILNLYRLPI